MLEQIPEVQARTRLMRRSTTILVGDRQFPESVDVVDPNFFQMIRLPLVAGDPASVFAKPESVVLSQTTARKYFGNESPVGKTIVMSGQQCDDSYQNCQVQQQTLVVTGMLRDLPHNTQLKADVMIPNTSAAVAGQPGNAAKTGASPAAGAMSGWRPGADPDAVLAKFRTVIDRSVDPMKHGECQASAAAKSWRRISRPFVDDASFDRQLWRHDAAGKLDHGLWFFRHRCADPADGLLQFHQSGHRPGDDAGPRDLAAQGGGRQARAADRPVPGRGGVDGGDGAGLGAGADRDIAAAVRPRSGLADRNPLSAGLAASALYHGMAVAVAGLLSGAYPALVLSGFPSGLCHAREQRQPAGLGPDCAPRWWCCSSRSRSVLASPRP